MKPVIVIRPEPGLSATLSRCKDVGIPAIGEALFAIEPAGWEAPNAGDFDGLLLGSANAIRQGGNQLNQFVNLPAYCVGKQTASAAKQAGFSAEMVGTGGLQELLDDLAGQTKHLLRLAGEKHVELVPPCGISIEQRIVYRSRALPMPAHLAERLSSGGIVMLHSADAAQHFSHECERGCIAKNTIDCALIGPRLDEAIGEGWRSVGWPDQPDDAALVAKAGALWHKRM